MRGFSIGVFVFALIAFAVLLNSFYIVSEREQTIKLRFGEVVHVANPAGDVESKVRVGAGPGLYFKIPAFENTVVYDTRNMMLDTNSSLVTVAGGERLLVDSFARYKITDPVTFYRVLNNMNRAESRLATLLEDSVRAILGEETQETIISERRGALMNEIRDRVNNQAKENRFGVEVIDVRIRRADLPSQNADNVYSRMESERRQEAARIRAEGNERERIIRANTDREVTVTIARAQEEAEKIKGKGEAQRNRLFAESFNLDPEFADFYRSLQAYEAAATADDQLIISPDSDFYRYFQGEAGN